jgi:UDP-2-acetamido-2-deoxy-ribo-hexuluronate aminotransferase
MVEMIPFIDLAAQRDRIRVRLDSAVAKVLDEGRYILGPEVLELEEKLGAFNGTGRALSCANGTDAIILPLMAMGIGPGDAVFVPSFTFAATAEAVVLVGAVPVFVDIDPFTFNLCPKSLSQALESVRSEGRLRPRAVVAVDLFGQPADYKAIAEVAKVADIAVFSDCAQGFGCTLDGLSPLHWADVQTVSFYPAKPLGAYGDAGAVLCKDDALYDTMKSVRVHGEGRNRYEYARIGLNSRLDTIQAAILLVKLEVFEAEIAMRQALADSYSSRLGKLVRTPQVIAGGKSTWAQYTLQVEDRDDFRSCLAQAGVPTAVYYPVPLHCHEPYKKLGSVPVELRGTERAASLVVSLPMYPDMPESHVDQVCDAIEAFVGS